MHCSARSCVRTIASVTTLVLTVIGDDRSGLVARLSEVVARHGGNWTTSQMAHLAGKFAGIVLVDIAEEKVDALTADLEPLSDLLDITVQKGSMSAAPTTSHLDIEFVGTDRPGIVHDITEVINNAGGSIELLSSDVVEAPMAGGELFTANAVVFLDESAAADLKTKLEDLADELMVEFTFGD